MPEDDTAEHLRFMRAALALGRRSMGLAVPNPSVGALVVKSGVVVGRGVTAAGGRPHAEPSALREAGAAAREATLYVTLEPCSHHGRSPPCVDAVLASGVSRVVVAIRDPDARVAGRGIARLRDHGIDVVEGVGAREARADHCGHLLRATRGRPMLTLKMAQTEDGYAAAAPGEPRLLITGPLANAHVQMMRATHDAVMIGRGTAVDDDPLLTVRLPGMEGRRPLRIVLDPTLSLSLKSRLLATAPSAPLLVFGSGEADSSREAALAARGAMVSRIQVGEGGLDLPTVLLELGARGLTRVFCEGGPRLASALVLAGLADRVVTLTSSASLNGTGRQALTAAARRRIEDARFYSLCDQVELGSDLMRIYRSAEAICSPDW